MDPDNQDTKYKDLFRKNEAETGIPEFDEILNHPARQKIHSGRLVKAVSAMVLCVSLVAGIYYYRDTNVSANEAALFKDKNSLVWEWQSPTKQLLSAPMSSTLTGFNLPTDYLSPQKISFPTNNKK
jgi:hypothetical protein